ncbi:MAG: DUF6252 family protein [Bacteroidales bacterium]|jgi:hypothetical protein|nr:DUF6252 family protein [Bacteroidales bacterium]
MKSKNLLSMLLIAGIVLLMSCNKNDDDTGPIGSNGSISLKVDGSTWNASLSVQAVNAGGVINVTGSDSNAKQAGITLYGITETGTYKVGPPNQGNMLRWTEGLGQTQTFQANGVIGDGTITVTELTDNKIKGTFSFTGFSTEQTSKQITEGKFEANF